ncbi:MAG: hypothetical protein TREMPRED_004191 [Tremellales sp. Tagirdzhanova-0007]|nr:MAG: hypothetical protein TREMPRED_004191 [Tremellales sp. Tagirdzhanova-0007]
MADIKVEGFKSSDALSALGGLLDNMSESDKKDQIKKTNGLFQLNVKNSEGKETTWVVDLKNEGKVSKGAAKKPDTFISLADGKLNGQKAFMTGALKVKGNVMMATKLDGILKIAKAKL